jgi:uncharacterized protein (DUF58 family)
MKSVTAAETAAIAAWRVLSAGDRVGALVFDDTDISVIQPHRSEQRVMQILNTIIEKNHALSAQSKAKAGPDMMNQVLQRVCALARHDCLVCLIGDAAGIDDETRKHITLLTEHNDVLSAFIYDPMEQQMPRAGRLVFSDRSSQIDVDTGSRTFHESYGDYFQQRLERMKNSSRKHSIPLLQIHTAAPVLEQIRDQLGHHPA